MEGTPAISVLMPVHNAEGYVGAAVESILGQSFGDFELLVVDDGSTDGSRGVLERMAARDGRIRLVSRANTGLVGALNEMLAGARGELVARMDADDVALRERFAVQARFLAGHPEVGAVGGQVELMDPEGAALLKWELPCGHEAIDAALLGGTGGVMAHPAVMMRAAALRRVGGYRKEFWPAEDTDLFLRLAEVTRLANVPEVVLRYRQHLGGTGYRHRARQRASARQAIAEAAVRRGLSAGAGAAADEGRATDGPGAVHRKWAWWALGSGEIATARKHAWRAMVRRPWEAASWRLAYCAARGR